MIWAHHLSCNCLPIYSSFIPPPPPPHPPLWKILLIRVFIGRCQSACFYSGRNKISFFVNVGQRYMKHKSIQAHSIWSLVVTLIFIPFLPNNHLTYLVQKIGQIIHFIVNYNPTRRHVSVKWNFHQRKYFRFCWNYCHPLTAGYRVHQPQRKYWTILILGKKKKIS